MAEKEAFIQLLESAKKDFGDKLYSITTDGNISIRSYMRKEEEGIRHGLDVWHLAKNLVKNLTKKCTTKVSIFMATGWIFQSW